MSARRACCRYTNCHLDKGLVPNRPCQPNANPSGVSFVYLRWRGDENRSNDFEQPYGPGETFVMLEVEEVRKQGHEVLIAPMHPRGLRLERRELREMGRQVFELTTPATSEMLSRRSKAVCAGC
jgi:hypothetical protein